MDDIKQKKKFKLTKKHKDLIFYIAVLAFPILQFSIFYLGVNINSILLAFQDFNADLGRYEWVGFNNFIRFFNEFNTQSLFKIALNNSLLAFVVGIFSGTLLGLVFSYYIYKKFFGHKFFKIILFAPSIISSIVIVTVFMQFVESGIPSILKEIFNIEMLGLLANGKTTLITVIFYNTWIGFGVSTLLYVSAMDSINTSIIEAAKMDGVNKIQEFVHIIMPSIWPTFTQFFIISVGGMFINQLNLFAFYGEAADTGIYTFGYYLYKNVLGASTGEIPYLATVGIILTLVTVPLTMIVRKLMTKFGPKVD